MATKRMLVDAIHPEETRVVVTSGNRLEEFDFESAQRQQLRGNIYLAKVTRVEPSLQAAFVEYGGNRHGFLAFSEIHPDYYQIPVADREALLRDEEEEAAHAEAQDDAAESQDSADSQDATEADESAAASAPAESVASEPIAEAANSDSDEDAHEGEEEHNHIEQMPSGAETVESIGGDDPVEEEVPERRRSNQRRYKIQEVIKRRQVMLVQVVKEERGNKGAALTTYLSLAGRYSVLMPNTARGGGISRKITSAADRKRLKEIVGDLEVPHGMGVILRTAGATRTKAEVKRDFEYLLRLWENVRSLTLKSQAPCLVYEEGSLIKRTIRDLYNKDIDEVYVAGEQAFNEAKDFMRMIMPSHTKNVLLYKEDQPLFSKYGVEQQLDQMFSPQVTLPSGGYIVINPTEALVSIDVNSGRATKEHNIEDTALQTNLEAADEIARQLRLRDLAGLIVIDFIDMMEHRSNRAVERRLKEALKNDRARIQVGRISHFGLMEMSRQRIRFGVIESSTVCCPTCKGTGLIRSVESLALMVMRQVEDHVMRRPGQSLNVRVPMDVALYILNTKRDTLATLEDKYNLSITVSADSKLHGSEFAIEKGEARPHHHVEQRAIQHVSLDTATMEDIEVEEDEEEEEETSQLVEAGAEEGAGEGEPSRRRRRRRRRGGDRSESFEQRDRQPAELAVGGEDAGEQEEGDEEEDEVGAAATGNGQDETRKRRRRGRRGGRRNRRDFEERTAAPAPAEAMAEAGLSMPEMSIAEPADIVASDEDLPHASASDEEVAEPLLAEPVAEAAPAEKPKRASRARKPKTETAPAEAAAGEAGEEPAPEKPKRASRSRKKVEAADVTAPAMIEETAVAQEARQAPEPAAEPAAEPIAEAPAAPVAAEQPAAEPAQAVETPAEQSARRPARELPEGIVATSTSGNPEEPKKKKAGWWQRGFLGG